MRPECSVILDLHLISKKWQLLFCLNNHNRTNRFANCRA